MKQMKKNSKNLDDPSESSISLLHLSGDLEVKSDEDSLRLYLDLDSHVRALSVEGAEDTVEVSSMSTNSKNLDNLANVLKDKMEMSETCNMKVVAVISSQDDDHHNTKLVHVEKVKAVKKDGKMVLRMDASVEDFEAKGKYARYSTDSKIPEGHVQISCYWDPYYGCVM